MSFLSDRTINFVNTHFALHMLAWAVSGTFLAAYFLRAGIALPIIFLALAAMFAMRMLIRPLALAIIFRLGLRRTILLGGIVFAAQYLFLIPIDGVGAWFIAFIVVTSFADILYWLPYHTYFSQLGAEEHRGKHVMVRDAMMTAANVAGPLVGGFLLTHFGPVVAFSAATMIGCVSAAFFVWLPEVPVGKPLSPTAARAATDFTGFRLFLGQSIVASAQMWTWPLVIFQIAHEKYDAFGGLIAFASLVTALGGLALGRLVDEGRLNRMWLIATLLAATTICTYIFFVHDVVGVVIASVLSAISWVCFSSIFNVAFYNSAKRSKSPIYSQFFAEAGWDTGSIISLTTIAGIIYLGGTMQMAMLVALPGVAYVGYQLYRYFERDNRHLAEVEVPILADEIDAQI